MKGQRWSLVWFPEPLGLPQCHRLMSQMPLAASERRTAEREGGRAFKGPGSQDSDEEKTLN